MDAKKTVLFVVVIGVLGVHYTRMDNACAAGKLSAQAVKKTSVPGPIRPVQNRSKTVNLSTLTRDTTFGQAIEILRHSTQPPLNIIVLWRDLRDNAFIDESTPILMDGVSGITLGKALELVLMAVSSRPGELGYVVQGGAIVIATRAALPQRRVVRVYDISDLVASPANYGFGPAMPGFTGFGQGWMSPAATNAGWGGYGTGALPYGQGANYYSGTGGIDQLIRNSIPINNQR